MVETVFKGLVWVICFSCLESGLCRVQKDYSVFIRRFQAKNLLVVFVEDIVLYGRDAQVIVDLT